MLEAQSVTRQQIVNRVFGSAYAELNIASGLTLSHELRARLHGSSTTAASTDRGPTAPARTSAPTARTRGSRRRPASSTRKTSPTRSTTSFGSTRRSAGSHQFDITGLYSIQHDRFTKDSLYASNLPYPTQLWYDLGSGTAGNEVSRISRVGAAVVHGPRELHAVRPLLALGHRSLRRFEPSGAGAQVGVRSRRSVSLGRSATSRSCANFSSLSALKLRGSYGIDGQHGDQRRTRREGTLSARIYTFGATRVRGYKPGVDPEPGPRVGEDRSEGRRPRLRAVQQPHLRHVRRYNMNTHDLLLTRLLPVTSGFTSTLQNVGVDEEHRVSRSRSRR